jgi:murein DD-endopeptidase MepM/ murein hydrolase activator NlpD
MFKFKNKQQLYFFCTKTLTYKKAAHPGWRNVKIFSAGMSILLLFLFLTNYITSNFLGNMVYNFISSERKNLFLSRNLHNLENKADSLEKALNYLLNRNKDLRLTVNLPLSYEDIKLSGVGGRTYEPYSEMPVDYLETGISNLSKIIANLSNRVKNQKLSYEEVVKKYNNDKEFFKVVPAIKPMAGSYNITGFGIRLHPILGGYRMHDGVDIIAPENTSVHASGDGVVKYIGYQGGYGLFLIIDHGYNYQSCYGHLSSTVAKLNETVKRGQLIAKSGNTGLSSGPHLHYEVVYNNEKVDPVKYFLDDVENIVNISLAK